MASYWEQVNHVISSSDVLLLVLDARFVKETRNREIEDKVKKIGKPLIYVMNKCDLVSKEEMDVRKKKLRGSVFVSSKDYYGKTILRDRILIEAKRIGIDGIVKVGVLGYPNVGKSSLINAFKGKKSAKSSAMSGYTKSIQRIRADNRIVMLDTPGVIPYKEKDESKHSIIGAIDFSKTKEPEDVVYDLIQRFPGRIESHYGVKKESDDILDDIAIKMNVLKKGGIPDSRRMAQMILVEWQKGNITP